MKWNRRILFLFLICISSAGCAAFSGIHSTQNEVLAGTLELEIQGMTSPRYSTQSFKQNYIVDLEAREWRRATSTTGERFACTYRLKGRRLHLELEMDVQYNRDRVPETLTVRRVITIDGKFAKRDGDFLRGPFKGTAVQQSIRKSYDDYRQEWSYSSKDLWSGKVTGQCIVSGEIADGIWAIPPSF